MTAPSLNHVQMSANGASGDNSLRGATGNRWQAPVRVTPLRWQDSLECPHLPGTLSPNQLGRGLRGSGPFSFTDRVRRVSSPALSAGDRQTALPLAVGRHPFHCGGPSRAERGFSRSPVRFKATDHQACKLIDPSPFVAHQSAPFAANQSTAEGIQTDGYRGQSERSHCI